MTKSVSLIIAGSDSGAGAGVQADLKTFTAHKIYAATTITAITAQNTLGVDEVMNIPTNMIEAQMKSLSKDLNISIIKIGMLSNTKTIEVISFCLTKYFENIPVVLDPVMVAKGGQRLVNKKSIKLLKNNLLKKVTLVTPNVPEAEVLSGISIKTVEDMVNAAKKINILGVKNVLIKGGHLGTKKIHDVLLNNNKVEIFNSKKIITKNTHGTGCTLSSAIATFYSCGKTLKLSLIHI